MEYLMTYGWAILVVMIVGVVLWYLGIFGGGTGGVNTASGFAKLRPLEPSISYYYDTYDLFGSLYTLRFTLVNGVGSTAIIQRITMYGDCDWQSGTHRVIVDLDKDGTLIVNDGGSDIEKEQFEVMQFPNIFYINFPSVNVTTGETVEVYILGCNKKISGQSFSVPLNITYTHTVAGTNIERQEIGTISGSAQ